MTQEEAKRRFSAAYAEEQDLQDLLYRARSAEAEYARAGETLLRDKAEIKKLSLQDALDACSHRRKALWWIAYGNPSMPDWDQRPLLVTNTHNMSRTP